MNEKLNTQDLIDLLAEKHDMSKKDADNFVKEFFLLIEESLKKDKYVKIKGLGTFKLIDVDSRESVNVHTGERFEIQNYTKVSFTPEPTLKDIVNKPFAHFETVALNENTVLQDTLLDGESEEEENLPEEAPQQKTTEEAPQQKTAEETLQQRMPEETLQQDLKAVSKDKSDDSTTMRYFIGIIVLVVLICSGAILFMYYPDLQDQLLAKSSMEKTEEVAQPTAIAEKPAERVGVADSLEARNTVIPVVGADTVSESLTVVTKPQEAPKESVTQPAPVKESKKPVASPFQPDSVDYTIAGTETTYTLKEGETLTKVALRFYGTKALWPYIVKHNPDVIKNPDNVPFGTTIKIPKLVRKQ